MRAFVISPIGAPRSEDRIRADIVLHRYLKPAGEQRGYTVYRGDELSAPGLVMTQIVRHIIEAELLLVYVRNNPNVLYELGIAHSLRRAAVLVQEPDEQLPFDIAGSRIVQLNDDEPQRTVAAIVDQIDEIQACHYEVESPVQIAPERLVAALARGRHMGMHPVPDVTGAWSGFHLQEWVSPDGQSSTSRYNVYLELTSHSSHVVGMIVITYGDDPEPARNSVKLTVWGTICASTFILLNYQNTRDASHCGQIFLELGDMTLNGWYVGYGIQTRRLVRGPIQLLRAT